jgi:Na+/melibiose symporter-like transporter
MKQPPSIRFMRAALGMVIIGLFMFVAAVATPAVGGPRVVAVIFVVLAVLWCLAGLPFMLVGARKSREENAQLIAKVKAEARQKKGGRPS